MQYQELIKLRAGLLDPNERADLERRLADAEKRSHDLQDELTALKGKEAPVDIAGPEDNGPGENRGRRGPGGWGPWQSMASDPKLQRAHGDPTEGHARFPLCRALQEPEPDAPSSWISSRTCSLKSSRPCIDAMNAAREQGINPRTDPDAFNQAITQAPGGGRRPDPVGPGRRRLRPVPTIRSDASGEEHGQQLQQALSYTQTPLTDDQASQMVQLLPRTSPSGPERNRGHDKRGRARNRRPDLGNGGGNAQVTPETMTAAQGVLSRPAASALQQIQTQQQTQQQILQLMRNANQGAPGCATPGGVEFLNGASGGY